MYATIHKNIEISNNDLICKKKFVMCCFFTVPISNKNEYYNNI